MVLGKNSSNRRKQIIGFVMVAPAVLFILTFFIGPMISAGYYSLFRWNLIGEKTFIGFENYRFLFADDFTFHRSFTNTLIYTVINISGTMVLSMLSALLLQSDERIMGWIRSSVFIPVVVPFAVMGMIWKSLLQPEWGAINQIITLFGGESIPWLFQGNLAMFSVILFSIWKEFGLYMIIFVGGLQNIPRQLYEAAAVDGVNVWQKFIFITLPSLKPILFFVSTMLLVNSFKAFDHIWVMTQGGPGNSTSVLMTYIYSRIYDSVGRASAASVILFVFVFVVTAVRNKLTGGESYGI